MAYNEARHGLHSCSLRASLERIGPRGYADKVLENWEEVGTWLIRRLRAETGLKGRDEKIGALLDRVLRLPDVAGLEWAAPIDRAFPPTLALRFCKGRLRLALFSVIPTVGTPLDVSLQDLRLELFFPADDQTAKWFEAR
jgi:hypothetical protein